MNKIIFVIGLLFANFVLAQTTTVPFEIEVKGLLGKKKMKKGNIIVTQTPVEASKFKITIRLDMTKQSGDEDPGMIVLHRNRMTINTTGKVSCNWFVNNKSFHIVVGKDGVLDFAITSATESDIFVDMLFFYAKNDRDDENPAYKLPNIKLTFTPPKSQEKKNEEQKKKAEATDDKYEYYRNLVTNISNQINILDFNTILFSIRSIAEANLPTAKEDITTKINSLRTEIDKIQATINQLNNEISNYAQSKNISDKYKSLINQLVGNNEQLNQYKNRLATEESALMSDNERKMFKKYKDIFSNDSIFIADIYNKSVVIRDKVGDEKKKIEANPKEKIDEDLFSQWRDSLNEFQNLLNQKKGEMSGKYKQAEKETGANNIKGVKDLYIADSMLVSKTETVIWEANEMMNQISPVSMTKRYLKYSAYGVLALVIIVTSAFLIKNQIKKQKQMKMKGNESILEQLNTFGHDSDKT